MNDLVSIIGTVASVGSIPLAFYLFIKSKENNIDKVRRDIIRILSHQIGSDRKLTTFEIQAVINSKLKENKINLDKLTVDETIEDLITEVISNPLINKEKKEFYLNNFETIFSKGKLLTYIAYTDSVTLEEITKDFMKEGSNETAETIIRQKIEAMKRAEKAKTADNLAPWFGVVGTAITVAFSLLLVMGEDVFVPYLFDKLNKYQDIMILLTSLVAGILTLGSATILKNMANKKSERNNQ